eukprot:TRINITY_DN5365_c0_g1_i6.p1 TRINITY_DN5365_c0_g1~~TRINITY_DN5365_c0_g1_i6.p1  ORF type:complete len:388 (+),score=96.89 TRINITY_DN5365_c0_g1_i6:1172-2335(+)
MVRYEAHGALIRRLPFTAPLVGRSFRPQAKRLVFCATYFILCFAWMIASTLISGYMYKYPLGELPDLIFRLVPYVPIPYLDLPLYALVVSAFARAIWHTQGLALARRFIFIAGTICMLRGFLQIATALPNPRPMCVVYQDDMQETLTRCGNAVFSSYGVLAVLCACVWHTYSSRVVVALAAWAMAALVLMSRVISREGYTLDLIITPLITVLVWELYHAKCMYPTGGGLIGWLECPDEEGACAKGDIKKRPLKTSGPTHTTPAPSRSKTIFACQESPDITPQSSPEEGSLMHMGHHMGSSTSNNNNNNNNVDDAPQVSILPWGGIANLNALRIGVSGMHPDVVARLGENRDRLYRHDVDYGRDDSCDTDSSEESEDTMGAGIGGLPA